MIVKKLKKLIFIIKNNYTNLVINVIRKNCIKKTNMKCILNLELRKKTKL